MRPANQDAAKHAGAIVKLLVQRIRQDWPQTKIVIRADSGFCRQTMLNWCDRNNVNYVLGIARNKNLQKLLAPLMETAKELFEETQEKQTLFTHFTYAAASWIRPKRIIGKAEYSEKGANPRFIVTNLDGDTQKLYKDLYCARGDMENRIKEQQLCLFADRTSCHKWWPNQFRMLLSGLAYVLIERVREIGLKDTILHNAQVNTIRLKLFKIGTIILKNTRRIYLRYSSHYPYQGLFNTVYQKLVPI